MKRLTLCLSAVAIGSVAGLIQAVESPYQSKVTYPEPPKIVVEKPASPEKPPMPMPEKPSAVERAVFAPKPEKPSAVERAVFTPKTGLPPLTGSIIQMSARADDEAPALTPKAEKSKGEELPPARAVENGKPMPGMDMVTYTHADPKVYCNDQQACGGYWLAGLGFYYLQPRWETDPNFSFGSRGGDETPLVLALSDLGFTGEGSELYIPLGPFGTTIDGSHHILKNSFDYEFVPRIVLGYYFGDGTGIRGSYWGFDANADSELKIDFVLTDTPSLDSINAHVDLTLNSNFELHVFDMEGTKEYQCGCWSFLGSLGLRYAELKQSYRFNADVDFIQVDGGDTEANFFANLKINHSSEFRGLGPTAALEVRRQLGCHGLSLYGSVRGTVLVGRQQNRHFAHFSLNDRTVPDDPNVDDINPADVLITGSRDDIMPVGEAEFGFEYARCCGQNTVFFFQSALVGQTWRNAGSSLDAGLFTLGTDGDLHLFGLKVTTGFVF